MIRWFDGQNWQLEKTSQRTTQKIEIAEKAWQDADKKFKQAQEELQNLQDAANADANQLAIWEQLLQEIIAQLAKVQNELNVLNTNFMTIAVSQQTPQTMSEIATQGEIVTTGAILNFIRPKSRVTALETVEGMVQLSYFDWQGKLRQSRFDATADRENSYFEQWLPDYSPVCLNCDSGSKKIALGEYGISLAENWTMEVNFVYPLPETNEWNTLIQKSSSDRHILIKDGKYIGTEVEGEFYYCLLNSSLTNEVANAYDLNTQIDRGWHNLVVVGTTIVEEGIAQPKTIFYIDGEKVGECLVKNDSNIQHIANSETGGEAFGKISELRIWNIALKDAEILANSQVYLTGNEPGLVAYYRLNEGSGTEARDYQEMAITA